MTITVERPPLAPFEVKINISGEDWGYVRRTIAKIAEYIGERFPNNCQMISGGAGGNYDISTYRRDISVDQFHRELQEWMERQSSETHHDALGVVPEDGRAVSIPLSGAAQLERNRQDAKYQADLQHAAGCYEMEE